MKSKKKILLVVNPVSGNIDKTKTKSIIREETEAQNIDLVIYETTGEEDKKELKKIIDKEDPDRLIVAGGDGTITMVSDVIKGTGIPMGILPAGSANGFAVNLGIGEDIAKQIEIALGDNLMEIDLIKLDGEICSHISDLGMNAELIKNYEKSEIRGKIGYILQCLPTLLTFDYPFQFEIETNEKKFERSGVLLAIANASKFGTGADINPEGALNDGKFELVIFKNLDLVEIFKTINGRLDFESEFVEIISTDKAKIRCTLPVPFQIDGQYQGKVKEVEASVHPEKLMIAVPSDFLSE